MTASEQLRKSRDHLIARRREPPQSTDFQSFCDAMSVLSEYGWSARWLNDLEYHVWEMFTVDYKDVDPETDDRLIRIADMALHLDCWVVSHWDRDESLERVSLEAWGKIYQEWKERHQ